VGAFVLTLLGIYVAEVMAWELGKKDPSEVVLDEVAGQLIALIAVPLHWKYALASLILFRAFDILKPPPVRNLEALPGGQGIMMDDVAAGLYALLIMQVILRLQLF
jgi:phosphatidylglycerophosphatase A